MTISSPGTPATRSAAYAGIAPSRPGRLDFFQFADWVAASAWFFVVVVAGSPMFANMAIITLIRYSLAAYFLLGLFVYPSRLLPVAARGWPAFVLPVMCIISSLWAPYPSDAIRKGIMLGMTGIVSIYFAGKITPRTLFYGYFVAEFICMALSYVHQDHQGYALVGIFNQKNVLALNMFFLYATGFTLILDSKMAIGFRAVGALAMPLALILIVLSDSATTLAMAGGCTVALWVQAFIWRPASRVPHARSFMFLLGVILILLVSLLVFGILTLDAKTGILSLFGKDATLTGRTYLWDQARGIMNDHPLTGVGANGFWHAERGQADSITKYFYYDTFVVFNFHNSYFENGVQLGYPGMYATIFLAAWGLFNAIRTWIMKQDLFNMTFLMLAGLIVIRSNTEIDLAMEFGTVILVQVAGMRRNEKFTPVVQPAAVSPFAPQARDR